MALAAEVAAIAEREGHNPDVARAMVLMEASLDRWLDELTPESQRRWQEQADLSIQLWMDAIAGLRQLRSLIKEAEELGLEVDPSVQSDGVQVEQEAKARLQWLRANREKFYR